jgi:NADPH:quinone reductase
VVALGEGVGGELVGRRVVTNLKGSGGYAERAVVSATGWRSTMRSRYSRMAGRLGLLRAAAPRSGERVLIEAAAGGVGSLLVQLARNAGATVVALAGGARKVEFAAELGAHHAIDYSAPGWAEQVGDAVGAVDVVFDGVGGEIGEIAFDLLDRGGPLFSYGLASGAWTEVSAERRPPVA